MKFPTQPWTKGFCPTLPSHHQPPNHLFHHKFSLWVAKLTEEWRKCTFCLYKWCQFFLCHSPGCPTALQEQPRKRLLVAVRKDVQGKVILKYFLSFDRCLAPSTSLSLTVHTSVNGFGLQQTRFRTWIPATGTGEENFITNLAYPIVSKKCYFIPSFILIRMNG